MAEITTDYLIIGNSAAGVTAAEHIRANDPDGSITMVSREPYPAYGRPLISYLIEGKTDEDHIWFKTQDFYDEQRIRALLGPEFEVLELHPQEHAALLANEDVLVYGSCLLATGSVPFTPPIPGLDEAVNVHTFITLDDAKGAREDVVRATARAHEEGRTSRVIVIGAGLIGLKAAEALSYHADEIVVLELAPRILPAVLDDTGAAILQDALSEHGIICKPGISMQELRLDDAGFGISALLTDGEVLPCDVVIAAVGVRPNSRLAVEAGAQQERGLVCDERLQTTLPDVYAAGDVVQVHDLLSGARRPLALWPNAMRQGRMVGLQMAGAPTAEPFEGSFPVNAVDFFDISLLTAGIIDPGEGFSGEEIIRTEGDHYAKFVVQDGILVGYILLNRPTNAGIYTSLIERRIPLETMDPAIFDDIPVNLDFGEEVRWERLHRGYPHDRDMRGWKESV